MLHNLPSSLASSFSPDLTQQLFSSGAMAKLEVKNSQLLRPLMIIVETINVCNSACVFCPYTIQTRPKGVMSEELFTRILEEYVAMGGGAISLTPMVGDILLDRKLQSRMQGLKEYRSSLKSSITTNLYALERWSDRQVIDMIEVFSRIHVSCYGITKEENREITQKDYFEIFCAQMLRLLKLRRSTETGAEIALGFRTIYDYTAEQLINFQLQTFGELLTTSGSTATYSNWGNSMKGNLPGHARWVADRENYEACLLLAIALQVYHDGRVSTCACCDYDASAELTLGSLENASLLELFNGEKNSAVWRAHESGRLPSICRQCTFHSPLSSLSSQHPALNNIVDLIGG